jgi:hypothetical protein
MIYQSRPSKLGHEGTFLIPASWNTKKVLASAQGFRDHDFLKLRRYALMKPNSNLSAKTELSR